MPELTPFEKDKILYEALVEAVGTYKAEQILKRKEMEYAMIKNSSKVEIR